MQRGETTKEVESRMQPLWTECSWQLGPPWLPEGHLGLYCLASSHASDLFLDVPLKPSNSSGPDIKTLAVFQGVMCKRCFFASCMVSIACSTTPLNLHGARDLHTQPGAPRHPRGRACSPPMNEPQCSILGLASCFQIEDQ